MGRSRRRTLLGDLIRRGALAAVGALPRELAEHAAAIEGSAWISEVGAGTGIGLTWQ